MNNIYLITDDFIFKTKIDTILKSLNLFAEKYNYFNQLDLSLINGDNSLFIVDLENQNLDLSLLKELKITLKNKIYLLGYCSHVNRDLMGSALKSGFDEVVPRSKFVKILPAFLKNFDKLNK